MKERLKKFYEENKEEIIVASMCTAAYLAGIMILQRNYNASIRRTIDGGVIETVEPLIRGDGVSVILAHARNGRTFYFAKDQ